jgi:4-hydroxythreonine-4-phosphate dehydrogenase
MNSYAFTCGDINGIGPEIAVKTLNELLPKENSRFILIIPEDVFEDYYARLNLNFSYKLVRKVSHINASSEQCIILSAGKSKMEIGRPTAASGNTSYAAIESSIDLLKLQIADAVVTAPISKTALKMAGINFPGHTEIYAGAFGVKNYAMTFLSKKMNCVLATIHEPLKNVPRLLKPNRLINVFDLTYDTLSRDLNISEPAIAVLGLNPHAGENGYIGREETDIILPAMGKSKCKKSLKGPFSPDAFFANKMYSKFDATIGMYHDQLLIPFKMLNFASGVNYTAGLPIIRTSPDHGVAFDIAGTNTAGINSFKEAFMAAKKINLNRKKHGRK